MTTHFSPTRMLWATLLVFTVFFTACSDDDPTPNPPEVQAGYFIVNEGGFSNANTSLSYYDRQNDTILNNIFEETNGRPLGDQAQSMTVFDDRGFIIVQNSAKIEVIDREDFTSLATIGSDEGIVSPRYFLGITSAKGYATDWGADGVSGTVKVLDLETYDVTATIPVGQGANTLVAHNNQVYVTNNGGYGYDSTVFVIDPQTDAVIDTIVVGDNPSSMVVDANGHLWVAGSGLVVYNDDFSINETESSPGFLARIENDEVAFKLNAEQISAGPANITIDPTGELLYYRYSGGVYRMSIRDTALPSTPFIAQSFYGLGVDPTNGEVLTGEAPNFSDDGSFHRHSTDGQLIKSYTVGIAPNGFAF